MLSPEEREKLNKILDNISMMDRARYEDLAIRLNRIKKIRMQVSDVQIDPVTSMRAESTKRVAEELET